MQTDSSAEAGSRRGERAERIGDAKRYASINVRTLAMRGDKNRKEACGKTAAAIDEWVMEFEERGLGIIGLSIIGMQNTNCDGWV